MSGEEQFFNIMTKKDYGSITFGDNSKARAIGIGSISCVGSTQVEQVLLVESLKPFGFLKPLLDVIGKS